MIDWLKGIANATWIGLLAFVAAFYVVKAKRAEGTNRKLRKEAEGLAQTEVEENIVAAEVALDKAKVANLDAKIAKEKARKKLDAIGETDPDIATIVSGWRSSRLRDN